MAKLIHSLYEMNLAFNRIQQNDPQSVKLLNKYKDWSESNFCEIYIYMGK